MITPEFLEFLRCPLDPSQTRLEIDGKSLVCCRCRIRFPIKEGIPSLIVEEAEMPPGCAKIKNLPCQQGQASTDVKN